MEKIFKYEETGVRVKTNENEEIWFAGIDVCKILDYQNPSDIIEKKLDDDEKKLDYLTDTSGQNRKTWTINEFGLYNLILTSSKPEAKIFKRWITHEVLPSIRKAGKYTTDAIGQKEAELQEIAERVQAKKNAIITKQTELKDLKKELERIDEEFWEKFYENPMQTKMYSKEIMDNLKKN